MRRTSITSPATGSLAQCRVLVVEDEFYIADEMALALQKLGAEVVGPVPTKDKALALLASEERIDAAILDINLKGQAVYPVADALAERGVPFVFATGYDQAAVPPPTRRFRAGRSRSTPRLSPRRCLPSCHPDEKVSWHAAPGHGRTLPSLAPPGPAPPPLLMAKKAPTACPC